MDKIGRIVDNFFGKKDSATQAPQRDLHGELAAAIQSKEDFNKQSSMDPVRADAHVSEALDKKITDIRNELSATNTSAMQPNEGGITKIMEANSVTKLGETSTTPQPAVQTQEEQEAA